MSKATNEYASGDGETFDATETDRHRLLADERRRRALAALTDRAGAVDLRDLAAAVASEDPDVDAGDDASVDRIAITLHHAHLPMMADLGVVGYDPASRRVEASPIPDALVP